MAPAWRSDFHRAAPAHGAPCTIVSRSNEAVHETLSALLLTARPTCTVVFKLNVAEPAGVHAEPSLEV
jgi:hypothetical protein